MPLYTYECEKCTRRTDAWRSIEERNNGPLCDCGGPMKKVLTAAMVNPDIFDGYLDPNLVPAHSSSPGTYVKGRAHRKQLMKELGMYEKG